MSDLRGKRVVLTGATDGIGLETAKRLAELGAELVLHGRSDARVHAAADAVRAHQSGLPTRGDLSERGQTLTTMRADFASLEDVRDLAQTLAAGPPIDLLIQNAGIGAGADAHERRTSRDGFELRWAVNFLAPFALGEWLIAEGKAPKAMINVASIGQEALDFDDLQNTKDYDGWRAYRRSKLALIIWTNALARRGFAALSVHPGTFLATKMVIEANVKPQGDVSTGADAILNAAKLVTSGVSGVFIDVQREGQALPDAYDPAVQQRLQRAAAESIAPFARGLTVAA